MGSYLTVVNDTPDPWLCKLSPDMRWINGMFWGAVFLAVIAFCVAFMGAGGIAVAGGLAFIATAGTSSVGITYIMHNVRPEELIEKSVEPGTIGITVNGTTTETNTIVFNSTTATKFSIATSLGIFKTLKNKKYHVLMPGERKRYGKMALSLWQQSACVKTTVDKEMVYADTVYMRPILSGSYDRTNRDHNIQWWINKKGTKPRKFEPSTKPPVDDKRVLVEDDSTKYSTTYTDLYG